MLTIHILFLCILSLHAVVVSFVTGSGQLIREAPEEDAPPSAERTSLSSPFLAELF